MDHHYQTMNPHAPNPLIMHYINPPVALVHTKFFTGNPPPHYRVFSKPRPPKGKTAPRKKQTNCTLVVDSSVCDNYNLILILVV